jgi:hypothetical protein
VLEEEAYQSELRQRQLQVGQCSCFAAVKRLGDQVSELRKCQQRTREEIEKAIRREVGQVGKNLSPYVEPAVRIGEIMIPVKRVEEYVMVMKKTLSEREKQLSDREKWVRRLEGVRDQLLVEVGNLREEKETWREQLVQENEKVKELEADKESLERLLQFEKEEASRMVREFQDEEMERQRRGGYI